ncbi:MAG: hypothetical protein PHI18_06025 [bacterium]|nr:hypothetical protein [bacterium]
MRTRVKTLLILLSISLNIAVIAVWTTRQVQAGSARRAESSVSCDRNCRDCPLHRRLGTSEHQWRRIAPLQAAFLDSSQCQCARVSLLRADLIELLAADSVCEDAVRAKHREILAVQERMQELSLEHILAEKKVLDPAQVKRLFDLMRRSDGCAKRAPTLGLADPASMETPSHQLCNHSEEN